MRKSLLPLIAAVSLLAAVAGQAGAVTNDYVADTEHPFVGLVAFYDEGGDFLWRCSGSLISPTVFLTAGHCADTGEGAVSARVWFQQNAGANYDPSLGYDPNTGYPDACAAGTVGTLCATSDELYNYGFANFAGFPNTHDAGLVILDQAITLSEYGQLPAAGILDELGRARGTRDTVFTVSGYGLTKATNDKDALPNISYRSRLTGWSQLVNMTSAQNDGYNLQTQGNGAGRAGTCFGDSGGPIFLGGPSSNVIVAVNSFVLNSLCRGTNFAYRVDRVAVLDWIDSKIDD